MFSMPGFQILSPEQADPFGSGLKRGASALQDIIRAQQMRTQQRFLEPQLEEGLKQEQLKTQIMGPQAELAPQMAMAELAQKQATPAATAAETALREQQAKFLPLEYAIKGAGAVQTGTRFGKAYQLQKALTAMPAAQRAQWIAENQEAYNEMLQTLGSKALQQEGEYGPEMLRQVMEQYFPAQKQQRTPMQAGAGTVAGVPLTPEQMDKYQNIVSQLQQSVEPAPELHHTADPQSAFGSSPEQTEKLQDIGRLTANQKLVNTQMNRRANSAIALEKWYHDNRDEYSKRIKNAAQYAGLVGKGQKVSDEWLNQHPNAIADYDWFINQFVPNNSNQIRMMEAMGATDEQRKELNKMSDAINNIKSNPQRAMTAINRMFSTVQDISNSVIDAAEPINKGIYRKTYDLPKVKGNYLDSSKNGAAATIRVQLPDGRIGSIPGDKISRALELGAKRLD